MWARPTLSDVVPMKTCDMVVEKPKFQRKRKIDSLTTVHSSVVNRKLFAVSGSSSITQTLTLADFTNSLYPECPLAVAFNYSYFDNEKQYEISDDVNVENTEECLSVDQSLLTSFTRYCKQFASVSDFHFPIYSDEQISQIEEQTRGQSENEMWFLMREGRVSASICNDVYTRALSLKTGKCTDYSAMQRLILERSGVASHLPAVQYGKINEKEAINFYALLQAQTHSNFHVQDCGLFIDSKYSFLCASPDSCIECDCCGKGIVEVKCPFRSAGKDPKECNLEYLQKEGKQVNLKKSHKYYIQIQCQLAFTIVHSKCGHHLERITFDQSFRNIRFKEICDAYSKYVLPELMKK